MNWARTNHLKENGEIRVTVPSAQALLQDMQARLEEGSGFSVATLNLDHVVKLRQQPGFHAAYAQHTHITADGRPIVWLSRLAGRPVGLVPGSELIDPVCAMAARLGYPVALLGSTDATLAATARKLSDRYPGLQIVSATAPPMGFDPTGPLADDYIAEIGASGARICFLALGAPKQEIFAARAFAAQPQTGFLSIGAGLDFIAGTQKRAPALVRRFAGEWLWRLMGNPRRLARRYGACIAILPGLFMHALQSRFSTGASGT
ncbi:WecB/TagA/CpsF family glycosyltransferase [uncultured Roseobacter sp.]|uniref:WecB/TagA/CpsF family glycosyltransferase n=1 Tax=uncultured Roseobacter sp. TaxID=114847 RepID=UPI00261C904A|nr:WecB/TagA/CpsF family glycosyltransferase [uncultured Roseobacter sp.]